MHSMTGFGSGNATVGQASAEIELRSVNGKSLNLKLRLPSERQILEADLEARVRKRLQRGSVQGQVRVRLSSQLAPSVDRQALQFHLQEWRRVAKDLGLEQRDPSLSELLAMPGSYVQVEESETVGREVRKATLQAMDLALDALEQARLREGARLAKELQRMLRKLSSALRKAEKRVPKAIAATQARLKERVASAMQAAGETDSLDLAREVIAIADRADVREEIARLDIHLDRLQSMLEKGGPVGRELEFVLQECHREITTLGNKSADVLLSEQVVAMKLLAGQFKEQVANVE
jgi:uncharacterized protein (TIGR00255 family)